MSSEGLPAFKTIIEWIDDFRLEEGDLVQIQHTPGRKRAAGPITYKGILQFRRVRSNKKLGTKGKILGVLVDTHVLTQHEKIFVKVIKRKSDV